MKRRRSPVRCRLPLLPRKRAVALLRAGMASRTVSRLAGLRFKRNEPGLKAIFHHFVAEESETPIAVRPPLLHLRETGRGSVLKIDAVSPYEPPAMDVTGNDEVGVRLLARRQLLYREQFLRWNGATHFAPMLAGGWKVRYNGATGGEDERVFRTVPPGGDRRLREHPRKR